MQTKFYADTFPFQFNKLLKKINSAKLMDIKFRIHKINLITKIAAATTFIASGGTDLNHSNSNNKLNRRDAI